MGVIMSCARRGVAQMASAETLTRPSAILSRRERTVIPSLIPALSLGEGCPRYEGG